MKKLLLGIALTFATIAAHAQFDVLNDYGDPDTTYTFHFNNKNIFRYVEHRTTTFSGDTMILKNLRVPFIESNSGTVISVDTSGRVFPAKIGVSNVTYLGDSLGNKYTKAVSDARYPRKTGTSSQVILGDGTFGTYSTAGEVLYNNGSLVTAPKNYTGSVNTTTGGIATFYLTTNGLSSGTAIFSNVYYNKCEVSDANSNYNYSYSLSGDKKTLTVTVKQTVLSLGILVFNTVPNNTAVTISVKGN